MADYPGSVYTPRTKENKAGIVYDETKTEIGYAEDVTKLDDEVVAIQTELGVLPKRTSADLAERLKGIRSLSDAYEDTIFIKRNRVGIRWATPGNTLEVYSGSSLEGIRIRRYPTGVYYSDIVHTSLPEGLKFKVGNGSTCTEKVRFTGAGNVGIGVIAPRCKLEVNGAIASATKTITASADNTNVSGINTLFVDTSGGNITLGGLVGGVAGQVLHIAYIGNWANTLTLEDTEGINQDFYMHTRANETIDAGGYTFVCDGASWYDVSHARHV